MRRLKTLALFMVTAMFAVSCGTGQETAEDLGMTGTLKVALDSNGMDQGLMNLHLQLEVKKHGTTDAIYTNTRDFAEFTPIQIHLKPGYYDVMASVINPDTNEYLYSGIASNVQVKLHILTGVTLKLDEAGGIQVLVEIGAGGDDFVEATKQPRPFGLRTPDRLAITQRNTDQGTEYWLFQIDSANNVANLYKRTTLDEFAASGFIFIDYSEVLNKNINWKSGYYNYKPSLFTVGSDLFLLLTETMTKKITIYRFNFTTHKFEYFSKVDVSLNYYDKETKSHKWLNFNTDTSNYENVYLGRCSMVVDNVFHLVCPISMHYLVDSGGVYTMNSYNYLFAFITSPDGRTWGKFPARNKDHVVQQSQMFFVKYDANFYGTEVPFYNHPRPNPSEWGNGSWHHKNDWNRLLVTSSAGLTRIYMADSGLIQMITTTDWKHFSPKKTVFLQPVYYSQDEYDNQIAHYIADFTGIVYTGEISGSHYWHLFFRWKRYHKDGSYFMYGLREIISK